MNKTRIAPTPSGYLHTGNAFNFLVTHQLAKALGSTLVLRIDDLDAERTRPEYIEDVFRSLEWLGIAVDEGPSGPDDFLKNWSQQLRIGRYRALAEELRMGGALYPCTCSRQQFDQRDRGSHECRNSSLGEGAGGTAWRLRIPTTSEVEMNGLHGMATLDLAAQLPDPVILQRQSERPAYQVASLCDDLEMGVSFIVRGADLLPSTACQLYLAEQLGRTRFSTIRFHHHPLAVDANGRKLSKSEGAASLKALRGTGRSPEPLIAHAAAYVDDLLRKADP